MSAAGNHPITPRLTFARFQDSDRADLAAILADPEVTRNITANGSTPERCDHYARRRIAWHNSEWADGGYGVWALRVRDAALAPPGEEIGWCGFTAADIEGEDPEILYALRADCRGKGLAGEAARAAIDWFFAETAYPGVSAIISTRLNPLSAKVVGKLGFVRRGTMPYGDFLPEAALADDVLDNELWRLRAQASDDPARHAREIAYRAGQLATCGTRDPETVFGDLRQAAPSTLAAPQLRATFQEGQANAVMDWYHLPRAAWPND